MAGGSQGFTQPLAEKYALQITIQLTDPLRLKSTPIKEHRKRTELRTWWVGGGGCAWWRPDAEAAAAARIPAAAANGKGGGG